MIFYDRFLIRKGVFFLVALKFPHLIESKIELGIDYVCLGKWIFGGFNFIYDALEMMEFIDAVGMYNLKLVHGVGKSFLVIFFCELF